MSDTHGGLVLDRYAEIYPKLAAALDAAPAGWTKAWAAAEMDAHQGATFVYYLDAAGAVKWITPPLAIYERFRELNNAARLANEGSEWTTATFVLEPAGTFTIDYGYDAVPIEEEHDRRKEWKKRYLPPA